MPSVCRRIGVMLVVACLGAALSAGAAVAQDAGGTAAPRTTAAPGLSPTPQPVAPRRSTTRSDQTPANPPAGRELPNTGLDTRALVLLGSALLLGGLGLRLRTAPERF